MKTSPNSWMVNLVGTLLPPTSREQILGDLEEVYRSRVTQTGAWRATFHYVLDAAPVVVVKLWDLRRNFNAGGCVPGAVPIGADSAILRRHVEQFQHENYCRLMFYTAAMSMVSVFVLVAVSYSIYGTGRPLRPAVWIVLAVLGSFAFTVYQHFRRGSGHAVPSGLSGAELVAFHRTALARRRDFLRTLWYWKMLPLLAPHLGLMVWRREEPHVAPLLMIVVLALTSLAARGQAQAIDREIGRLDGMSPSGRQD